MISKQEFKTRAEWLEARRNGIGGSDVATLKGVSPWSTRQDLIIRKKFPSEEQQQNAITGLGSRIEKLIVEDFVSNRFDDVEAFDDVIFTNSEIPRLQASPDVIAKQDNNPIVIEIKFVNFFGGTNWKDDEGNWKLPEYYWMQVQHYMTVLEIKQAKVIAFMQELNDTIEFDVDWDEQFAYQLRVDAVNFFDEVEAYTGVKETSVKQEQAPLVIDKLKEIRTINNTIKSLTSQKKNIQEEILSTYEVGTNMEYNNIKGIIYKRKTNTGETTILKVA